MNEPIANFSVYIRNTPPGMVVSGGLMFYCWCFFLFICFWHFAALYLRAPSADRRETFRHDCKCV